MYVPVKWYCLLSGGRRGEFLRIWIDFPVTHQLCQSLRRKRGGGETFVKIFAIHPLIRWQQLLAIKMCLSLLGIHGVNTEMDSAYSKMKTISSENKSHGQTEPFDWAMSDTEMVTIPVCIRNSEFASPSTMNLPLLLQDALESWGTKKPCSFTPAPTFLGSPSCSLAEDITGLTMALSMQLPCLCLAITHKRKLFRKKCWSWIELKDWVSFSLFPCAPLSLKKTRTFPLHNKCRRK